MIKPSSCCEGETLYLLCTESNCDVVHEFEICEICGKDNTPIMRQKDCPRPDGFQYEGDNG
jgi:hypothetical protein